MLNILSSLYGCFPHHPRGIRSPKLKLNKTPVSLILGVLIAGWGGRAAQAEEPGLQVGIHGDAQLIYRYANVHGALGPGGIGIEPGGAVRFDVNRSSDIFLPSVHLALTTLYSKWVFARLSMAMLSTDFRDDPLLSPASLAAYRLFLRTERATGQSVTFNRTGILQDAYVSLADPSVNGAVIVGQQPVPVSYWHRATVDAPVTLSPVPTPLTDYINLHLLPLEATPYQNSTMVQTRDIGILIAARLTTLSYQVGLFSGSGPNRNDDNHRRDIFWRIDANTTEGSQFGFSQQRGRDIAWRLIGADWPGRVEYERIYNAFHGRMQVGQNTLLGEYVFTHQLVENEQLQTNQSGWYLTSIAPAAFNTWLVLQYATFFDEDVRRDGSGLPYSIRRFTVGLRRELLPNQVTAQLEFSRTWENLLGTTPVEQVHSIFNGWQLALTAQL